jgi:hypothetical protein
VVKTSEKSGKIPWSRTREFWVTTGIIAMGVREVLQLWPDQSFRWSNHNFSNQRDQQVALIIFREIASFLFQQKLPTIKLVQCGVAPPPTHAFLPPHTYPDSTRIGTFQKQCWTHQALVGQRSVFGLTFGLQVWPETVCRSEVEITKTAQRSNPSLKSWHLVKLRFDGGPSKSNQVD